MKKFFALLVTLAMTVSLAACTSDTETSQSDPPSDTTQGAQGSSNAEISTEAKTGELKIGVSINATSNQHNQDVYETLIANAEDRGHEVIATNANGAAAQQTTDIENLIEQNCDVIIIANGEAEALINVVARAKERGIYVISYESGWIEGCDTMFAVNDFASAAELYMKIAAEMGFEGKIITMHHNDHPVPRAHYQTMLAILNEYSNIELVNDGYTGFPGTTELAYDITESALIANPDIKAIWCSFDLEAIGALQACQAMGRDDILIVGYDGEEDVLKMLLRVDRSLQLRIPVLKMPAPRRLKLRKCYAQVKIAARCIQLSITSLMHLILMNFTRVNCGRTTMGIGWKIPPYAPILTIRA